MELVTLKPLNCLLMFSGWIGILSGVVALFFLNIGILTNFAINIDGIYSVSIVITFIFSMSAIFSKASRSLGIWGISLSIFLMLFQTIIFFLGWMVSPFP